MTHFQSFGYAGGYSQNRRSFSAPAVYGGGGRRYRGGGTVRGSIVSDGNVNADYSNPYGESPYGSY